MTDDHIQQRLSDENSQLKVLLWEARQGNNNKGLALQHEILKDKIKMQQEKHEEVVAGMKEKARKQQEEIEKLHQRIQNVNDEDVIIMPKDSNQLKVGQYVTLKKHEKLQKQIVELTEQLNKYENIQTIQEQQ